MDGTKISPAQRPTAPMPGPRTESIEKAAVEETQQAVKDVAETKQNPDVLAKLEEFSSNGKNSLMFDYNQDLKELVVTVIDKNSGEVIRQIPSEEMLEIKHALEALSGIYIDKLT